MSSSPHSGCRFPTVVDREPAQAARPTPKERQRGAQHRADGGDGTIPSGRRNLLLGTGDSYLRRFGESIDPTRAWSAYGEGPTKMGGGNFVTPRGHQHRHPVHPRPPKRVLYGTVLGRPGGTPNSGTPASGRMNPGTLQSVQLLGSTAGSYIDLPNRSQDSSGLHIFMPSSSAPFSAPA